MFNPICALYLTHTQFLYIILHIIHIAFDPNEVKSSISGNKSACELPAPTPFADDVRMTSLSDDGAQGIPEVWYMYMYVVSQCLQLDIAHFSVIFIIFSIFMKFSVISKKNE